LWEFTPVESVGLFSAREFTHLRWLDILLEGVDSQIIAALEYVVIVVVPEVSLNLVLSSFGLLEYLILFS
jgi:hypothetical protein